MSSPINITGCQLVVEEVAVRLGLSTRSVRRLIASRQLGFVKISGAVRVPESCLAVFIAERFIPPEQDKAHRRRSLAPAGTVSQLVDAVIKKRQEGRP